MNLVIGKFHWKYVSNWISFYSMYVYFNNSILIVIIKIFHLGKIYEDKRTGGRVSLVPRAPLSGVY